MADEMWTESSGNAFHNPRTRWDMYEQQDEQINLSEVAAAGIFNLVGSGGLVGPGLIAGEGGGLVG